MKTDNNNLKELLNTLDQHNLRVLKEKENKKINEDLKNFFKEIGLKQYG